MASRVSTGLLLLTFILGSVAGSVLGAALVMAYPERGGTPAAIRPPPIRTEPRLIAPRGDLAADEQATIELFQNAAPAVVFITTLRRVAVRQGLTLNVARLPEGTGSGFLWDGQGHVVTNFHVIETLARGREARITLHDQSEWNAELVGVAPEFDLAVLRIDASADRLAQLPVGEAADLQVGQKVFAIGNPFGLDYTLTTGVISALEREIETRRGVVHGRSIPAKIYGVIQTDAAINPGNSGGPLLDSAGRVIGVNTAIQSPSGASAGIGFAVPVDIVNRVVPQLIATGRYTRPALGIRVGYFDIQKRLRLRGVLVADVYAGSAAEAAGIQPAGRDESGGFTLGDVIVSVGGEPVAHHLELLDQLNRYSVGDTVVVGLARDGTDRRDVEVTLQASE